MTLKGFGIQRLCRLLDYQEKYIVLINKIILGLYFYSRFFASPDNSCFTYYLR